MKNILLSLLCSLCFANIADAQYSGFVDQRLKEVYTEDHINRLAVSGPNVIKYLNWKLDNSYVIIELPLYKVQSMPYLMYFNNQTQQVGDTVLSIDSSSINIYNFAFEREFETPVRYRIGDTGEVIVFFSSKYVANEFNKHNTK